MFTSLQEAPARSAKTSDQSLVLSFDVEDWHQLLGRYLAAGDWDRPTPIFERQMRAIFDFLDQRRAKATFFLLGVTIKNYPEIAQEMVRRGDEIASHGYAHEVVYSQSREAFRRDLLDNIELLDRLVGRRPIGYRAPLFSINRQTVWALEELAELGFQYDTSLYDSPKVPDRIADVPQQPFELLLPSGRVLWEFPPAVLRLGQARVPVGGGSYWRVLPSRVLHAAIRRHPAHYLSLYFHPYECGPDSLVPPLPAHPSPRARAIALYSKVWYGMGRRQLMHRLRAAANVFQVTNYEQALDQIKRDARLRTRSLSQAGILV